MEQGNGGFRTSRAPLKTINLNWKQKLRESCCRRVREGRTQLLWKMRLIGSQSRTEKEYIKSALQDIVSDELKKMKSSSGDVDMPSSVSEKEDELWEYDGLNTAYQGDCEEILLEMQRIFYEDLQAECSPEKHNCLVDEEDEYLAQAVFQHMQLSGEMACKEQIWCPICKEGELLENRQHIYCSLCQFQLGRGDEVNLQLLRSRLAEVHEEHLERGCRSKPAFSIESKFDLSALYIHCEKCNTFEVVI